MKRAAPILAALAVAFAAAAAPVRTATEGFVTNRIAQAAAAATNYTDAATTALGSSLSESLTRASIAATNYTDGATSASRAYTDAVVTNYLPLSGGIITGAVRIASADFDIKTPLMLSTFDFFFRPVPPRKLNQFYNEGIYIDERYFLKYPYGDSGTFALISDIDAATNAVLSIALDGSQAYTDAAIASIPPSVTPAAVTNIVRELSLDGIWDAELDVWWTPVMSNGSLTYQATTNVNLNAEN